MFLPLLSIFGSLKSKPSPQVIAWFNCLLYGLGEAALEADLMEADPTEACLFWACPFWSCPFWTSLGGLGGFDGLVAAFIMNVA